MENPAIARERGNMAMVVSNLEIAAEFDRLAVAEADTWGFNHVYHKSLLKLIPAHCQDALDVGCGTGAFSAIMAKHVANVVAIDLSTEMTRLAKLRLKREKNVAVINGDALSDDLGARRFDFIISMATFHHMPFEKALKKLTSRLHPGGRLVVLDLLEPASIEDYLTAGMAIMIAPLVRYFYSRQLVPPPAVRQAWAAHAKFDHFLSYQAVIKRTLAVLPGAKIRRLLFWRYLLVWDKEY
jgi:ubiquinone/menaquinone biosynthesis C-methylase UbiE